MSWPSYYFHKSDKFAASVYFVCVCSKLLDFSISGDQLMVSLSKKKKSKTLILVEMGEKKLSLIQKDTPR